MHIRQLLGPGLALALLFSAGPAVAQGSNAKQNQQQRFCKCIENFHLARPFRIQVSASGASGSSGAWGRTRE